MKRRDFLKTTTAITTSSLLFRKPVLANANKSIGLQLYTVRRDLNKDLIGTLTKVAEIGYKHVELAGYRDGKFYGKTPGEFKKITDDLGLKILSTHNGLTQNNIDQAVEDAGAIDIQYIVLPFLGNNLRKTLDDYRTLCDQFNKYGEACKKAGLKFAYHNHAFEFEKKDGQIPYDILVKNTDKDLVSFELDLFWIKKAGYEPIDYFDKFPGRFSIWHVKDLDPKTGKYTEVGKGNIDFQKIFDRSATSGMKYFFVELDNSELPALESIKISFDYLNQAEFVQ